MWNDGYNPSQENLLSVLSLAPAGIDQTLYNYVNSLSNSIPVRKTSSIASHTGPGHSQYHMIRLDLQPVHHLEHRIEVSISQPEVHQLLDSNHQSMRRN
jgi:hypothetical protein